MLFVKKGALLYYAQTAKESLHIHSFIKNNAHKPFGDVTLHANMALPAGAKRGVTFMAAIEENTIHTASIAQNMRS
jgi:hypothetical protein